MLVEDVFRKCVAFLGCLREDYAINGTLFFVAHPIEGTDHFEGYAITTRHCVEGACSRSKDGGIYLRLNEKEGAATWLRTDISSWVFHEDDKIDLAALPLHWDAKDILRFDHFTVGRDVFLNDEDIAKLRIGPGQDLYFPGLFVRHPGNQANVPIIRTGTLAAMPRELIRTSRGLARVHLAELRSIGGHSGSPVFVHLHTIEQQWTLRDNETAKRFEQVSPLLGMVQGFFPLDKSQFDAFIAFDTGGTTPTAAPTEDFNSGIAAVIPAPEILHLLGQESLKADRKREMDRVVASRSGPTVET